MRYRSSVASSASSASSSIALIAVMWVATLLLPRVAEAAPLGVRVRGSAKLSVRASRDQATAGANELVLAGSLTDDAGEALPLQTVTIEVTRETDPRDEHTAEGLRNARGCDPTAPGVDAPRNAHTGPSAWGVRAGGANEVVVVTDESGRFCFRARLDPDRYKARLVYRPQPARALVDGVERELMFDLSRRGLSLRFDPTPHILPLDAVSTSIEAVAIVDDDAAPHPQSGLSVILSNEKIELARSLSDTSGRARFVIPTNKLGPPGPGELRLSFVGDNATTAAAHVEEIERHVAVRLKLLTTETDEVAVNVPEDGVPLVVNVDSIVGPISEGSVEARIGDLVVGAAPVEHGSARLLLTFSSPGSEARVDLRYAPASPWYQASGELPVRLRIRGPSLLSKAPVLLAGLAMLAFFLIGRIWGQKSKVEPATSKEGRREERDAIPRIDVIQAAEHGQTGWLGRVLDAHEGTPVPEARVWIEQGTFEGRSILASGETDAYGRFRLPGAFPASGDQRMGVEARYHSRFLQDLPPPGEIAISISSRRRAVLAKLVTWARRKGAPFDARPEPTPGHVRQAAVGDVAATRWANAVEQAAFGPDNVDARSEQEIESLAPDDRNRGAKNEPSTGV